MNERKIKSLHSQRGATTVETALVFSFFLLLLYGIIEFGRVFFVWNTVQEVTRHAARAATVANIFDTTAMNNIRQAAIFRTTAGALIAMPQITDASIRFRYLNAAGNVATPSCQAESLRECIINPSANNSNCIRFVETTICGPGNNNNGGCGDIAYTPWLPVLGGAFDAVTPVINIPRSRVVMPAETLGYSPALGDC
jgi:Flp pilus assembly protein TadG